MAEMSNCYRSGVQDLSLKEHYISLKSPVLKNVVTLYSIPSISLLMWLHMVMRLSLMGVHILFVKDPCRGLPQYHQTRNADQPSPRLMRS